MLRYVIAFMLLFIPTLSLAQEMQKNDRPQVRCGPTEEALAALTKGGYKIGGMGDLVSSNPSEKRKILILYNIAQKSLMTLVLGETPDGDSVVCMLNKVENFNTPPK